MRRTERLLTFITVMLVIITVNFILFDLAIVYVILQVLRTIADASKGQGDL